MAKPSVQHVARLNHGYKTFFTKTLPVIAFAPYAGAFLAGAALFGKKNKSGNWIQTRTENAGKATMIALSVVPVLPVLTLVTMALAVITAALVALSMLLAYPVAASLDAMKCCTGESSTEMKM